MVQSPGRPFEADGAGIATRARLVLVRHSATDMTDDGRLQGPEDDSCSSLGEVQAHKVGEFLMDMKLDAVLTTPMQRGYYTGTVIAKCQGLAWDRSPVVQVLPELVNFDAGSFKGKTVKEVCCSVTHTVIVFPRRSQTFSPLLTQVPVQNSVYTSLGPIWLLMDEYFFEVVQYTHCLLQIESKMHEC